MADNKPLDIALQIFFQLSIVNFKYYLFTELSLINWSMYLLLWHDTNE